MSKKVGYEITILHCLVRNYLIKIGFKYFFVKKSYLTQNASK